MKNPRPYKLMVDSGREDEPDNRWFGSLEAVWRAHDQLPAKWLPFAEVRVKALRPNGHGFYFPRIDRQGHVQP